MCVIADAQLTAAVSAGRAATLAVSGPAPDVCVDGGEMPSFSVADAASPFMIKLLSGSIATVSLCCGRRSSSLLSLNFHFPCSFEITQFLEVVVVHCTIHVHCRRHPCSTYLPASIVLMHVADVLEWICTGASRITQQGRTTRHCLHCCQQLDFSIS